MSDFFNDRDNRGQPLEILIADHFHSRGIPIGFNPYSGTNDPRREDYDIYTGQPDNALLWEIKMDWLSGITGNTFIEEKTLRNTKAHKMIIGRLILDTFDVCHLRELYEAKNRIPRENGTFFEQYRFKHLCGGDQPDNRGMLLDWRAVKENSRPLWLETKTLTQKVQ